jgi:hypothetical protein
MSIVAQIVVTSVLACVAVVVLLIAVVADSTHTAWFAFAFGILAQASYLDVRARWREAHRYPDDNLRSIR